MLYLVVGAVKLCVHMLWQSSRALPTVLSCKQQQTIVIYPDKIDSRARGSMPAALQPLGQALRVPVALVQLLPKCSPQNI